MAFGISDRLIAKYHVRMNLEGPASINLSNREVSSDGVRFSAADAVFKWEPDRRDRGFLPKGVASDFSAKIQNVRIGKSDGRAQIELAYDVVTGFRGVKFRSRTNEIKRGINSFL